MSGPPPRRRVPLERPIGPPSQPPDRLGLRRPGGMLQRSATCTHSGRPPRRSRSPPRASAANGDDTGADGSRGTRPTRVPTSGRLVRPGTGRLARRAWCASGGRSLAWQPSPLWPPRVPVVAPHLRVLAPMVGLRPHRAARRRLRSSTLAVPSWDRPWSTVRDARSTYLRRTRQGSPTATARAPARGRRTSATVPPMPGPAWPVPCSGRASAASAAVPR